MNRFKLSKCIFLLSFLFLAIHSLHAQQKIQGHVLDADDNHEPISFATVQINGTTKGVNTNLDGFFEIEVDTGEYVLVIMFTGYRTVFDTIQVDENYSEILEYKLLETNYQIEEIEISSDYNPAYRIVKNAIKNKDKNNTIDKLDSYEHDAYTKMVLTMDNIKKDFLDKKMFKHIKDVFEEKTNSQYADSNNFQMAAFISESLSHVYFQKADKRKEVITATQTSGVEREELSLLNSMFVQVNIYKNFITIVERQFVSPIANGAFQNYDYYLKDYDVDENIDTTYTIEIIPKKNTMPTFKGIMYINSKDWAVKRIDIRLNGKSNINFIEDIHIRQEFKKYGEYWMPELIDLEVDMMNSLTKKHGGKNIGVLGRITSYKSNYVINKPIDKKVFKGPIVEVEEGAGEKNETYWKDNRRIQLEKNEKLGYEIVDSLKTAGFLDFYIKTVKLVTNGFYETKYIDFGPIFNTIGYNQVEGFRTRFGLFTSDEFSKRLKIGGYVAYGFTDEKTKYAAEAEYRLKVKPNIYFNIRHTYDIEQSGLDDFIDNETNLLNTILRRVPLTRLNYFTESRFKMYQDVMKGLAVEYSFKRKEFIPAYDFVYLSDEKNPSKIASRFTFFEFGLKMRISFQEQYLLKSGVKQYIYSKWPVFNVQINQAVKGLLDGELEYTKILVTAEDKVKLGRFGFFKYELGLGKVYGTLPFPALHVFRGNQTYGYDPHGFNLMNYFEFFADQFATLHLDWYTQGYIWAKLPLLKKLKFKEVFSVRAAYGTISEKNREINIDTNTNFIAPDQQPYTELGVGLENILKFIRIDAIWRVNYLDTRPDIEKFGLRIMLRVRF